MKYIILVWTNERWVCIFWCRTLRDARKRYNKVKGKFAQVNLIKVESIEEMIN